MSAEFAGQRILIWGAGRSGVAAAALLRPLAAELAVVDDAPAERLGPGVRAALGDVPLFAGGALARPAAGWDLIVVSPGVPADHPALREAKTHGVPVLSELEVGARFAAGRVVAITGTNGKTTVTALTAHLLGGEPAGVHVAGNVGTALCAVVQRPEARDARATLVVEVSSYQCEHLERFHPCVAAVLNLRPDHLQRHGTMEGYRAAKAALGRNLTGRDAVVVNADDEGALGVVRDWAGERLAFSVDRAVPRGAHVRGDDLVYRDGAVEEIVMRRSDLRLPGLHNVANALAAAAIARRLGVAPGLIAERCRTFRGVPHRIEWVANVDAVDYFNDSKATNLDSLMTALRSFARPVVLIAGGRGKGEDLTVANSLIRERVRRVILIGEEAEAMERAWGGLVATERAGDLGEAVARARAAARPGDAVLLSPACASFDMFRDFEDRGEQFRGHVHAMTQSGGQAA